MIQRSPLMVLLLTVVTLGLYSFYWVFVTTTEINESGGAVPHPILSLVPIVNLWWLWRYSGGVSEVTRGDWSAFGAFALLLLLPGIGAAWLQSVYNRCAGSSTPAPA